MTLPRDAVTIEDTLMVVIGELQLAHAAETTGRQPGYLAALTRPNRRERLTVHDLELLDLAHAKKFGRGFPLLETLVLRMETHRDGQFADAREIGRVGCAIAKEGGEAAAACMEVALSNGNPQQLQRALTELEEAQEENHRAIALVRSALGRARDGPDTTPT